MEVEAKGIAEPITLYELHGIGGAYSLFLPEREEELVSLQQQIPLQYTVLEGEHVGRTVHKGHFITLSAKGGEVRSDHAVAPWSNLRIRLLGSNGETTPGELYVKVLRHLPGVVRASMPISPPYPQTSRRFSSVSWRRVRLEMSDSPLDVATYGTV